MTEIYVRPQNYSYTQARRHERLPASWHVLVKSQDYRPWDELSNLSEGGLAITTTRPVAPMTIVELLLAVPHEREPIPLVGRVMWIHNGVMGVRLERPDVRLNQAVDRLAKDLQRL